jgi:hypothetical protein
MKFENSIENGGEAKYFFAKFYFKNLRFTVFSHHIVASTFQQRYSLSQR